GAEVADPFVEVPGDLTFGASRPHRGQQTGQRLVGHGARVPETIELGVVLDQPDGLHGPVQTRQLQLRGLRRLHQLVVSFDGDLVLLEAESAYPVRAGPRHQCDRHVARVDQVDVVRCGCAVT